MSDYVKTKEFIERALKVHGDRYDYHKSNYTGYRNKMIIICSEHGEFLQSPNDHLRTVHGCPKCYNDKKKYSVSEWIKKVIQIHGELYNYSKVEFTNIDTKVVIICKKHGEFTQSPHHHIRGSGCQKCALESRSNKRRLSVEEFIESSNRMHNFKYNYSEVNYTNMCSKIIIICPEHGKFQQCAGSHLRGKGCKKCGIINRSNAIRSDTLEFIEKANKIFNNKYDYSKTIYITAIIPVTIICLNHGDFQQTPYNHLRGCGCSKCNQCPGCQLWRTFGELCVYCKNIKTKRQHQKTKELKIVRFLKRFLPDHEFIHNKSVGRDCTEGHLFPDIRFDCGHYQLIVEVDEHRHRGADYECDRQRMYDIIAKLGQPCIFIRYNPDGPHSNPDDLLDLVEQYLDMDINEGQDKIWDDHGFKVEYLFY